MVSSPSSETSVDDRFDGLFSHVAQAVNGIEPLLDLFFSFLQRKTDFFSVCFIEKNNRFNECEQLVLKYLKCYAEKAETTHLLEERRKKKQLEKTQDKIKDVGFPVNVNTPKVQDVTELETERLETKRISNDTKTSISEYSTEEDDKQDDTTTPLGNGGTNDRYTWTQTLSTVDMHIHVPPGTRSKDLSVDITKNRLRAKDNKTFMIEGEFEERIRPDETMWTLVDNSVLQISLEKTDGMRWWSCVLKGDPTIDTKKIVPENSKLSDLDGQTRSTVEKMLYDQKQQNAGLPTSEQQKQKQMLEKFKHAHPEMDFSNATVNWGGGMPTF